MFDTSNTYDYEIEQENSENIICSFISDGIKFYVELIFRNKVISELSHYEFQTSWLGDHGIEFEDPPKSSESNKRSNTVALIFRDEIVPYFMSQSNTNRRVVEPTNSVRKRYFKMLVNNFVGSNVKVFDDHNEIVLIKK